MNFNDDTHIIHELDSNKEEMSSIFSKWKKNIFIDWNHQNNFLSISQTRISFSSKAKKKTPKNKPTNEHISKHLPHPQYIMAGTIMERHLCIHTVQHYKAINNAPVSIMSRGSKPHPTLVTNSTSINYTSGGSSPGICYSWNCHDSASYGFRLKTRTCVSNAVCPIMRLIAVRTWIRITTEIGVRAILDRDYQSEYRLEVMYFYCLYECIVYFFQRSFSSSTGLSDFQSYEINRN